LETYEQELEDVSKAQAGDNSAYERLYRVYRQSVFSSCLRLTRNVEDAEDLTQQVFLRAYLNLHAFRGECKLGRWLYKIAVNEFLMHLRKQRDKVSLDDLGGHDLEISSHPHPADAIVHRIMVSQVLVTIPTYTRKIVLLRHIVGWSQRELANFLGIPLGTTKAQLSRARKALRGAFKAKAQSGSSETRSQSRRKLGAPHDRPLPDGSESTLEPIEALI
jgi:RNA polymerase sigma factor (sigma-70 family)